MPSLGVAWGWGPPDSGSGLLPILKSVFPVVAFPARHLAVSGHRRGALKVVDEPDGDEIRTKLECSGAAPT